MGIISKPIVSWYQCGDPCFDLEKYQKNYSELEKTGKHLNPEVCFCNRLTDINIINTRRLSDNFINFCMLNKHRVFIHFNISGLNQTPLEPNIPSVRESFMQLKKLINFGFPQKQILVVINPILSNQNGIEALKLLLRLFTEFKVLRLRFVRFNILKYTQDVKGKYFIANSNITKRKELLQYSKILQNDNITFWKEYYKLLEQYKSIINIDKGEESIIGVRELMAFGITNNLEIKLPNGEIIYEKIITYDKGNKYKPIVNIISDKKKIRCVNKCLLCPYMY